MSVLTETQQQIYDWIRQSLPPWLWQKFTASQEYAGAVAVMLDLAKTAIDGWFDSSYLLRARANWLDQHARDRGTSRREGETDDVLAERLRRIDNAVTVPALEGAADGILTAAGLPTGARITSLRRDRAFMGSPGKYMSYLNCGYRMTSQANAGALATPPLVASGMVLMLPQGTSPTVQASADAAVRQKKAGGFYLTTEVQADRTSPFALPSYEVEGVIRGGEFDFEATIRPSGDASVAGTVYLFAATTADGELSLRYVQSTPGYVLRVRGVDVVTTTPTPSLSVGGPTVATWRAGDEVTVRAWHRPVTAGARSMGIRVSVNGAMGFDTTGTASGSALAEATDCYLGGHPVYAGAGTLGGIWGWRHSFLDHAELAGDLLSVDGVWVGDGLMQPKLAGIGHAPLALPRSAYHLSRSASGRVLSLALHNSTVANQSAALNALSGSINAPYFMIQLGMTDIDAGSSAATVIAALNTLVGDLSSNFPDHPYLLAALPPAAAYLTGPEEAVWAAVNEAISGGGATPIQLPSYAARVTDHTALLNDGSNNLRAEFDSGDGLHMNHLGFQAVMEHAFIPALQKLGVY